MKKLFSFISVFALAAILGFSTVSAQTTVATVEKLWSKTVAEVGATIADTRQGTGVDGKVYLLNKANQSLVAISAEGQDTVCVGPLTVAEGVTAALDGTAYALDDAANFVMVGTFPNVPSHIVLRKADGSVVKDLAITGLARTDFINAVGDVFSAEGGYVFVYGNSANLLVYTIANGELVGEPINVAGPKNGSNNYVIAGNATKQIAHHRTQEAGWVVIENGVETLIENMEGFKKTTMGGDIITLAGKEFYIYPAGATNYNSEFAIRNMTDGALVADKAGATTFYSNTNSTASSTITACWLNASKIDDNNAYIHVYNADGVAVFQLSVVPAATVALACDTTMGSVEGAADYAIGSNATVKAIPALGHSFVAWLNGADTVSTKAEYTFEVKEDVALTAAFQKENDVKLTLAVNDATLGAITLPEGIVMGENTVVYGTKVALTAAPVEGATFNGWYNGDALYSAAYTIEVAMTADLALTANFVKVLKVEYVLNGGITNDFGWTSKGAVALELQADYNAAYGTSKAWAKAENGYIYYQIGTEWVREDLVPAGTACTVTGFIQNVTYNTSDNLKKLMAEKADKYGWLNDIIIATRTAAGLGVTDADLIENTYRKELAAFFLNSPAETSWPAAPSYEVTGSFESFKAIWKQGFANPTDVICEVALNEPYHPELTFYGWYTNAEFTGEKVTKISPETVLADGKLYAKLAEYIPTIAEVLAMEEGTETLISGVVNWVRNSNVFIQDATGGFLIYGSGLAPEVGTKIVARGKRGSYNGKPQVSNAVIESTEKGELFAPVNATLATFLADTTSLKYFGQRVQVLGVYVAEYDSYGNLWVSEKNGSNKIQCYYMTPDQATFPVGKKISITAVASSNKGVFQFEGDVAGIELVIAGKKENYTYPTRYEGRYSLENNWVISNIEDNFAANKPGANDYVRGMAAKDGIMYFINREDSSIVRVDGKTGDMLDPIKLTGEHLFQKVTGTDSITGEVTYAAGTTLPFNDIKFDQAGNCLIGACLTGATACQTFFIYVVDLATGACTKLIEDVLWDNPGLDQVQFRFDAFGAAGDVTKNGVVMAADANGSWNVYRWLITDGVAGEGEQVAVLLDPEVDQSLYINAAGYGTAPQIFPQDEAGELFYVDGFNTLPMLFYGNPEEGAQLLDDFINVPTGVKVWNNPGDTISMNANFNGLIEFQVGEEYFLLMVAANNTHSVPSTFALYKFADEDRMFSGMEPLWYFPHNGLGTTTIGCRTAVPSVDVVSDTEAILYLYATNNGYATYTLKIDPSIVAVEDIETIKVEAKKVLENGNVYVIKNGVKYNVLGAEVK